MEGETITLNNSMRFANRAITSNEKQSLKQAQDGDTSAFEQVVKSYQQRVQAIAYRIVGDREGARDVAQEVFIRLYRFLGQYKNNKQFFTWLYRIIVNASFDYLKKQNRFQTVPLEDIPENIPELVYHANQQEEMAVIITKFVDTLSSPQRAAFLLREVENLSCKEIGEIMQCPTGTVRSYLFYARKNLKSLIEKHYPEYMKGHGNEL